MAYYKNNITFCPLPTTPLGLRNLRILTGRVFTRLTVLGYAGYSTNKRHYWWCECECGKIIKAQSGHLNANGYQSCGCLARERVVATCTIHGESGNVETPEYQAYCSAKRRCENPNVKEYANYGGRGIEFRFDSYKEFLEAVGRRSSSEYSLDRINVNGHYEKGNLRWTDRVTQQRNTRNNKWLTVNGVTKCMAEWAETAPIDADSIWSRLHLNWCDECAITQPKFGTCIHRPIHPYFRAGRTDVASRAL